MSRRYHIRWPALIALVVALVSAWLVIGFGVLIFVAVGLLLFVVGAGGAGIRQWWGEDPSDVAQRETDMQFRRRPTKAACSRAKQSRRRPALVTPFRYWPNGAS